MPGHAVPDENALDLLVARLLYLQCPKVPRFRGLVCLDSQAFVFVVIMVWGQQNLPRPPTPFRVIEFFAGDGNVGKSTRKASMSTCQLDVRYGVKGKTAKAFDMLQPEGFVCHEKYTI